MNLEDALVTTIFKEPPKQLPEKPEVIKEAEVVDEPPPVCMKCEVEGSKPLPNGTCDICGAVWETSDEDDFFSALDLLHSCASFLTSIMKDHRIVRKMGHVQEVKGRDLLLELDDFLEDYIDLP